MFKENYFTKKYNIFFYIIILSIGFYLSSLKGYGSDRDSPALISVFINFLEQGIYSPSRGYGHPIAEFIIGFLAYNFGATVSTYFSIIIFRVGNYYFEEISDFAVFLNKFDIYPAFVDTLICIFCIFVAYKFFKNTSLDNHSSRHL